MKLRPQLVNVDRELPFDLQHFNLHVTAIRSGKLEISPRVAYLQTTDGQVMKNIR